MSTFTNTEDSMLIKRVILEFHTDNMPFDIYENPKDKFGIIQINIEKTDPIKTPLYIYCNLDISDSMNEYIQSKKKINYLKKTM